MTGGRLRAAEPIPIGAAGEHVKLMQRRIGRLRRDALGFERLDKSVSIDAGEGALVVVENVGVLAVARDAAVVRLRRDAGDLA